MTGPRNSVAWLRRPSAAVAGGRDTRYLSAACAVCAGPPVGDRRLQPVHVGPRNRSAPPAGRLRPWLRVDGWSRDGDLGACETVHEVADHHLDHPGGDARCRGDGRG